MARFLKKQAPKEVKPFGKLGFVGTRRMEQTSIEVFDFTDEEISHLQNMAVADLQPYASTNSVSWINVCGLHDTDLITEIANLFDIHPMVIDKISNTDERPSFEDYDDYLVLSVKQLRLDTEKMMIESEHTVFILMEHLLLSFQESEKDAFESIRERLNKSTNRVRKNGTDYLLFALNRALVNEYKIIIEHVGEKIEELETEIFARPSENILEKLNSFNTETNYLIKYVKPVKEAIFELCKSDSSLIIPDEAQHIMNHVLDAALIASESCENYRTMIHDQLNIYHTNVSSRLNEMFRILTIFSVIFVPLTFVAGVYGMNFDYIPELSNPNGYYIFWGFIVSLAIVMIIFFKRKGWL